MTEVGTVNQAVTATSSLEARAARGATWSMIGFVAGQALRFVGNMVLTRLLFEETFGLMLLVQAFLTGLHLFSDFGIGPSIIQNKRGDDPVFVNTAFTMQAGRGLILWMITWAGALPFAAFYNEPILAWILPSRRFHSLARWALLDQAPHGEPRASDGPPDDHRSRQPGRGVRGDDGVDDYTSLGLGAGSRRHHELCGPHGAEPHGTTGPAQSTRMERGGGPGAASLRQMDLRQHHAHVPGQPVGSADLRQARRHEAARSL